MITNCSSILQNKNLLYIIYYMIVQHLLSNLGFLSLVFKVFFSFLALQAEIVKIQVCQFTKILFGLGKFQYCEPLRNKKKTSKT